MSKLTNYAQMMPDKEAVS